ncbi:MAG: bifunctional diaminohydroxyphosphoribosylaminopyrimidine deaminase/5-amino-6-(5-phosphoribosylamino)uracil reductase RibD [Candidatus Saganbacteria bacterium]|nr:bifunctional diaminohydroxyphosphoribosylaminopyrimidine deaminase/5-amino-6-(5-phosphoribosylamino)uracil reductase RibD [Candidatus Saganbacteria bacterium]
MISEEDIKYMREALKLAGATLGRTSPDPVVGAILVKDGNIISTGYHGEFTTPHAEAWAIEKAGESARGSTLYINLEPCCIFGHNPPCSEKVIKSGIRRVVAAMEDPNPLVSGKGFSELREAGVEVLTGVLEEEAKKLNEVFVKFITTGRPFVIMKSAMTLDGKIATVSGESFWITGMEARRYGHYLRSIVDAVMVGVGTVITDDPELTVREYKREGEVKPKNPHRIILDTNLNIPLSSKVLHVNDAKTLIVCSSDAPQDKIKKIKELGPEVLFSRESRGRIELPPLMEELGKRNIASILIEGGGNVNASAIESGIVDKVIFLVSPKIIGGERSKTPVEGEGIEHLSEAVKLRDLSTQKIGEDIMIEGYIIR